MHRRMALGLLVLLVVGGMTAYGWSTTRRGGDPRGRMTDPQMVLADLLGLELGRRWEYAGEGNEFAAFSAWVAHAAGNLFQMQEDSGGTVLARIVELRFDGAYEIYTQEEHYSAESLLASAAVRERAGVPGVGTKLLPWPLTEGITWTLPTGETATLVSFHEQRVVPFGSFDEVIHVNVGPVDRYYAPGVGLIERLFSDGEFTVASRLRWTEVGGTR